MGNVGEFAHTEKQSKIMRHVLEAADLGKSITLAELRDKLPWKPSKQAVLCSLQFLENHGMIIKTYRGNRTMEITPTRKSYYTFRTALDRIPS
jgi:hypothetical protein